MTTVVTTLYTLTLVAAIALMLNVPQQLHPTTPAPAGAGTSMEPERKPVASPAPLEPGDSLFPESDGPATTQRPSASQRLADARATGDEIPLVGTLGESSHWKSGWLDLSTAVDIHPGDRLRIEVGKSAGKVLVRLLGWDDDPNDAVGIVGRLTVPASRTIEVPIGAEYSGIHEISVHGGPIPFGQPLGEGNGAATLLSVTLIRRQTS